MAGESAADGVNRDLLETRRAEALVFFEINQAGRTAVERVVALFFSVAAIAGSVGVAAGTPDVALPLPALLFLLLSYMFEQYGDLTVLGTARRQLEEMVNDELGGKGLIYETAVAVVRKSSPLVRSVRLLQSLLGLVVVGATTVATVVASSERPLILVGYCAGTALAAGSALYSYIHMLGSAGEAKAILARQGLDDRQGVWLPGGLYDEAMQVKQKDEMERETILRLLRRGLNSTTTDA